MFELELSKLYWKASGLFDFNLQLLIIGGEEMTFENSSLICRLTSRPSLTCSRWENNVCDWLLWLITSFLLIATYVKSFSMRDPTQPLYCGLSLIEDLSFSLLSYEVRWLIYMCHQLIWSGPNSAKVIPLVAWECLVSVSWPRWPYYRNL